MMKRALLFALPLVAGVFLSGCGQEPTVEKEVLKPRPAPVKPVAKTAKEADNEGNVGASHQEEAKLAKNKAAAQAEATLDAPEGYKVTSAVDKMGRGTLKFVTPEGWTESDPNSSMRILNVEIPGASEEAAAGELAVFGPMGGSVEANIQRWVGQIIQPDGSSSQDKAQIEEKTGDHHKFTLLDVSGNYQGMSEPVPLENQRILGAIIESPIGPWFLKAVGPHDVLGMGKEDFVKACESALHTDGESSPEAGSGSAAPESAPAAPGSGTSAPSAPESGQAEGQ